MPVLTIEQALEIRERARAGEARDHLANLFGVTPSTIRKIKRGDLYSDDYIAFVRAAEHMPEDQEARTGLTSEELRQIDPIHPDFADAVSRVNPGPWPFDPETEDQRVSSPSAERE